MEREKESEREKDKFIELDKEGDSLIWLTGYDTQMNVCLGPRKKRKPMI